MGLHIWFQCEICFRIWTIEKIFAESKYGQWTRKRTHVGSARSNGEQVVTDTIDTFFVVRHEGRIERACEKKGWSAFPKECTFGNRVDMQCRE